MKKKKRIFVFKKKNYNSGKRDSLYAVPEDLIQSIESQKGSENCYLKINEIEVQGSFDELLKLLGERVDFN